MSDASSMIRQTGKNLTQLPLENILHIQSFLDPTDIISVRKARFNLPPYVLVPNMQ
ncbi:hypothetical protein Hypma_001488 [Hypsizygus marmoreus]|uniref:F-box domain-containing protein n=1 Tax=Hypsizygus marmoreus TaxID=39966 RepID=A0A369KAZ3_HYPMA|nr:hypothetical protein Hypma_001488 [Hypsizygus marmoreus]